MVPSTPSTSFTADREGHAEISLLYKQVMVTMHNKLCCWPHVHPRCVHLAQMRRLSSIDSALIRLLGDDFSLVGFHVKPVAKKIFLLMKAQLEDDDDDNADTQKKVCDGS
jgi:hypothetical protein